MRGAIWIAAAAALLVAAVLYLRSPETGGGVPSAGQTPAAAAWPKMRRTAHLERRLEAAVSAPPSPNGGGEIDRAAFAALQREGSALVLATGGPNATRGQLGGEVAAFATELSLAQGRARTPAEVQMVALYADALAAYRDALEFWELRRFADRPGEDAALDALAAKYGIQAKDHLSYTAEWQGYPNAFAAIWAAGNAHVAAASALYGQ